jgi:dTDP-glucose 4,6-dehydratase
LVKGDRAQVYNIGAAYEKRNLEIAREILRRLSLPDATIGFVGDRPGHDFRYSLDCAKIHRLGWKRDLLPPMDGCGLLGSQATISLACSFRA